MATHQHHSLHRVPANMYTISVVHNIIKSLVDQVVAMNGGEEAPHGVKRPTGICPQKVKWPTCGKKRKLVRTVTQLMEAGPQFIDRHVRDTRHVQDTSPDMSVDELDYFFGSIGAVPGDISEDFCDPFSWDVLSSTTASVCV
jgi:hypothetical protein